MNTHLLKFVSIVSFLFITSHVFAQAPNKKALQNEINDLFLKNKLWDAERLTVNDTSGLQYTFCATADCVTSYVWNFSLKQIDTIKVEKVDEYTSLSFICKEGNNAIKPAGAGRYEPKGLLQFFIKNKAVAKKLELKLKELQKL